MNQTGGVSLKPSDAQAGGGGYDDLDVRIEKCRFITWDYAGNLPAPVLGLEVAYKVLTDGFEFKQVYSAGDLKHFVPSQDGRFAIPVGSQTGLNDQSNAIQYLASLVNAGFPEDRIANDVAVFEGVEGHVNQVPQKERKGLAKSDPTAKAKTVLVMTQITKLPWEKGKVSPIKPAQAKTQVAAPVASPAPSATEAPSNGVVVKSVETVMGILMAKGGTVTKAAIAQEAFKTLANDPDRNAVVQAIYKDEFLHGKTVEGGVPWQFDGKTISLG